jgi:hypothetical protein
VDSVCFVFFPLYISFAGHLKKQSCHLVERAFHLFLCSVDGRDDEILIKLTFNHLGVVANENARHVYCLGKK